jgi:hypothetical protein
VILHENFLKEKEGLKLKVYDKSYLCHFSIPVTSVFLMICSIIFLYDDISVCIMVKKGNDDSCGRF